MKTVLLIDDDRAFRATLGLWLSEHGWRVIETEDATQGLDLALEQHPDIVLCDLMMPNCNGLQFCRNVRAKKSQLPNTTIIVITGSGYSIDRMNALEAGADHYIVKPIQMGDLTRLMERILQKSEAPSLAPPLVQKFDNSHSRLRFWGVRGSIPSPGQGTVLYGGNTSCVEVRTGGQIIILDAGTGIRGLGLALNAEFKQAPMEVNLLITHTHWDHIQGFPFFLPAYDSKNKINIIGFEGARRGLQGTLSIQMDSPYFPVGLGQMPGNINIQELKELEFQLQDIRIQAHLLHHPGVCTGYRLFTPGGSLCYVPDVELYPHHRAALGTTLEPKTKAELTDDLLAREQDEKLVEFLRDAEVLILDSQYTAQEYAIHTGWGHTCVDDAVNLALRANVKKLFLFHHDPDRTDDQVSRIVSHARRIAEQRQSNLIIEAAREGMETTLEG